MTIFDDSRILASGLVCHLSPVRIASVTACMYLHCTIIFCMCAHCAPLTALVMRVCMNLNVCLSINHFSQGVYESSSCSMQAALVGVCVCM